MNSYLVMTQQIPTRRYEVIEAPTISEAAEQGIVMLLIRSDRAEDD